MGNPSIHVLLNGLKATLDAAEWEEIGQDLGVDFNEINPTQWIMGCRHEMEHWETVRGDPITIAKIAWDHLKEDSDYYRKLTRMESE